MLINNKFIKWVLIPLLLLILWFFLSLLFSSYKSFTVLQYFHETNGKENDERLLAEDKVVGEIIAKEDNLGIVSVKFGYIPRVDYDKEDELLFRIKKKGDTEWLYENKYRSGVMESNNYFTFGFIPLSNSSGETYIFEIISLKGNNLNGMYIETPLKIISKYKFSIKEITSNKKTALDFVRQKAITFFTNYDNVISSSIFLLPLVFYITLSLLFVGKHNTYKRSSFNHLFSFFIILLIVTNILFIERLVTGLVIGLLGFWIIVVFVNKYDSEKTYRLAFFIAALTVFAIYFNFGNIVDRASTYVYLLIFLGLVQDIFLPHWRKKD